MTHHTHSLNGHEWHQEIVSESKQIHRHGDHTWHFKTDAGWLVHREDGPAQLTSNSREWFKNGKPHREDGPARMFKVAQDGTPFQCEWWLDGKLQSLGAVNEETFNKYWVEE